MEFLLKKLNRALRVTRIANIHYFEFTANYETQEARHPFRELIYVDNGSLIVHAEGYDGVLGKGEIVIHRENELHALRCPDGVAPNVAIVGFKCDEPALDRFAFAPCRLSQALCGMISEIVLEGRDVFLPPYDVPNLYDMKKRPDAHYGAEQLLLNGLESFFVKLIRGTETESERPTPPARSPLVGSVIAYLERNYRERIYIDELAFLFNTNRTTMCGNFHAETGETISHYVTRLRITHAKALIREGKLNFAEIAAELNFPSQAYFNRVFLKTEGITPGQYIHSIRSVLASDEEA